MAEVFLSKATSAEGLERNLVIKRILPELCRDHEFVTTFINEARLASCLKHPNIVQIFDLGCVQDSYFLSMEYVRGYDLATVIHGHGRAKASIPLPIALSIWIDLFIGLDFAHHATDSNGSWLGVVHRDVTPGNVLVSHDGEAKILDFGIAKATNRDDNRTKNGTLKGKLAYLAPEQVVGGLVDMRADIFAGTLTIYELLTNLNPNRGETPYQTLSNATSRDAPDVRQYRPDLPDRIAQIIHKGLTREVELRYQSCGEIVSDLRHAASELGIVLSHNCVTAYMRENAALFEPYASALGNGSDESDITGRTLYLSRTNSTSLPKLLGSTLNNPNMERSDGQALAGPEISYALLSQPHEKMARKRVTVDMARVNETESVQVIELAPRRWPWVMGGCVTLIAAVCGSVLLLRPSDPSVRARLAPEPVIEGSELAIESEPAGAQVLISQPDTSGFVLLTGATPLANVTVTPEVTYDYKVVMSGYRSVRGTFHVVKDEHRKLRVELHRE